MRFDEVALKGAVDLRAIAKLCDCSVDDLKELNPALRSIVDWHGPQPLMIVALDVTRGDWLYSAYCFAARGLEEVSLGDFVLSGGEIAALAVLDACVRLLPGVMGKEASGVEESFSEGLLEYPQYTRPAVFEDVPIPEVLTSGDHAKVAKWRRAEAERLTKERRPDLWAAYEARKSAEKWPKT